MTMTGTAAHYGRELDRLPDDQTAVTLQPADPAPILGTWFNTNSRTWGILRAHLERRDDTIWVRVIGADPRHEPHDWGEVVVDRLYTDGPRSTLVCGWTATFDLGHATTRLQANQNHGLTVIAAFTAFTDGSGRSGYLSREFYHRGGSA